MKTKKTVTMAEYRKLLEDIKAFKLRSLSFDYENGEVLVRVNGAIVGRLIEDPR